MYKSLTLNWRRKVCGGRPCVQGSPSEKEVSYHDRKCQPSQSAARRATTWPVAILLYLNSATCPITTIPCLCQGSRNEDPTLQILWDRFPDTARLITVISYTIMPDKLARISGVWDHLTSSLFWIKKDHSGASESIRHHWMLRSDVHLRPHYMHTNIEI